MPDSFGARLRKRREDQAIALSTIVDETKIKQSLLEALERDDVSHWPTGIFRRAYIRAYAEAIGLDPDAVVREFVQVHPEPAEVVETVAAIVSAAHPARPEPPPTRLRNALSSAIDSLSRLRRGAGARVPTTADDVAVDADGLPDLWPEPVPTPPPTNTRPNEVMSPTAVDERRPSSEVDFAALARLCTEVGRVESAGDLLGVLRDASRILDAAGLILWAWDGPSGELVPALVHGYSDRVLAHLPPVKRDSDNATAAAFRSGQTCAVTGSDDTCGALAVPLLTPAGCTAVLALELQHRGEQNGSVRAAATILAAMLAQIVGGAGRSEEADATG